jgi:hypothetical protein
MIPDLSLQGRECVVPFKEYIIKVIRKPVIPDLRRTAIVKYFTM